MSRILWRITLPDVCYDIVTGEGHQVEIVEAPPIARWAIGKPLTEFYSFVFRKKGKMELVERFQ